MDLTDLVLEARRLSELLDKGIVALRQASVDWAHAEHDYRKAKAIAYLRTGGTVAEREAHAESEVGALRLRRDLASGEAEAAREAVRARRTQLSSVQSLLNAHRAEAEFARVGPRT